MEFYKVLKSRRSILRISQEDLAEISEISLSTIKNIEREKGNPSLKTIEKITEKHANVEYLPSRAIDVKSNVLDINKAKKILNYTCNTDIESGIRKFIEQKESLLLLRSNNENNPIKNK